MKTSISKMPKFYNIHFTVVMCLISFSIGFFPGRFNDESSNSIPWDDAPEEITCTVEEMERVKEEMKFCKENTEYNSRYCYGSAILRVCEDGRNTKGLQANAQQP